VSNLPLTKYIVPTALKCAVNTEPTNACISIRTLCECSRAGSELAWIEVPYDPTTAVAVNASGASSIGPVMSPTLVISPVMLAIPRSCDPPADGQWASALSAKVELDTP
jgi:hypothetical protein